MYRQEVNFSVKLIARVRQSQSVFLYVQFLCKIESWTGFTVLYHSIQIKCYQIKIKCLAITTNVQSRSGIPATAPTHPGQTPTLKNAGQGKVAARSSPATPWSAASSAAGRRSSTPNRSKNKKTKGPDVPCQQDSGWARRRYAIMGKVGRTIWHQCFFVFFVLIRLILGISFAQD